MKHAPLMLVLALCLSGTAAAADSADARLEALGKRLERLADANQVEIVQRTYGYFVDKAMWTEVSDLFAENGTYEIGGRGIFLGRKRVLEYLQVGLGAERPVEGRLINHMQFQPIVTVAEDGKTAKLRMKALVMSNGGWGDVIYENSYVKENGVWKIASIRAPFVMYSSADGWAKATTPNTRPESFLPPPDRMPTEVYLTYPSQYVVPFHYPNPVSGKPYGSARSSDILIDDTRVFPESVTSTSHGAVMAGSMKGIVYRALPSETVARAWIRPDATNGLQAVFGVLADEPSNTFWVCSVPNPFEQTATPAPSALVGFELSSGRFKASYPLPGSRGVCNDIAVGKDGVVYATDTPNGRLLELRPGASALAILAEDDRLKGIDGLAFSTAGVLYVNIVTRGALIRVDRTGEGNVSGLQELKLSQPLAGPDGFRLLAGERFLLAEGPAGRITEVTIAGDAAQIRVLREGLNGSPGVTSVGEVAYAIEGKIGFLIDPALKGKDPGAFTIHRIPLK